VKAKHLYFVLIGCCCIAIVALLGIGYGANRLLSQQANKLSKLRANTAVETMQETTLVQDKKEIAKYTELNTIAESIVPQDKDQAEAVGQIVNLAGASGISKLSSITFLTSTLGVTTTGAAKPGLTQLTPVEGLTGVYYFPITIAQDSTDPVSYSDFLSFLQKIEQNRRTAEVTSITVSPSVSNPNQVSFTLVVNEFIKP
jgi:hypothetical protein